MKDHDLKFQKLPKDGVTRFVILASDADKSPESYGMMQHYFAGDVQYAAKDPQASRIFDERVAKYPELNWEIYELLPNRGDI